MFTGLVEDVGVVTGALPTSNGLTLQIQSNIVTQELRLGDSVAVNGACLTVTELSPPFFRVEAVQETLERTTLSGLRDGMKVNLERAIQFGARMGGHFVQGHVDCRGEVVGKRQVGTATWFSIQFPRQFSKYVIEKGSIAIDGISLTVARKSVDQVEISVIPFTLEHTTLKHVAMGDAVNIEFDMLAKYMENFVAPLQNRSLKESNISEDWLREQGFL